MAINFPSSPSNNDEHTENGVTYIYSTDIGAWLAVPGIFTGPAGDTGPAGANGVAGYSAPLSIVLEYPTNAEKVVFCFTDTALTVRRIVSVLAGTATPNVVFSIRSDANVQATGTEVVTGGIVCTNVNFGVHTTSFNNADIAANSWIWLSTTAQSGTVNSISVSILV